MKISFLKIITILIIGFFGTHLNAQNPEANITYTKVIDASADDIWSLLREMDDIDRYSSAISKVSWKGIKGEGGQRICYPPEGQSGYFKESILSFDDINRTYTYSLDEGMPIKGMVNSFKVVDLGYQKSMIVWTSVYDQFMDNPQMSEEQFLGFVNQTIGEMIGNLVMTAKKA